MSVIENIFKNWWIRKDNREKSYVEEFEVALKREIEIIEERVKVRCVILFGSTAYIQPRTDNTKMLSDVDLLIITDDDARGKFYSDRSKKFGENKEIFSEKIPKAELFIFSISALKNHLQWLISTSDTFDYDTTFLQALNNGIKIQGQIPEELFLIVQEATKVIQEKRYQLAKSRRE